MNRPDRFPRFKRRLRAGRRPPRAAIARAALVAGAVAFGSTALAQPQGPAGGQPRAGGSAAAAAPTAASGAAAVAPADRRFIDEAAMDGLAEVEMGRVAQQKASNPQVRQFAERMVAEHGKANDELKRLAAGRSVVMPGSLGREHRAHLERLDKASGADFDRQYMALMVADHRKAVDRFTKAGKDARDAEIKAFASRTLPTLQQHHDAAKALHDQVKASR